MENTKGDRRRGRGRSARAADDITAVLRKCWYRLRLSVRDPSRIPTWDATETLGRPRSTSGSIAGPTVSVASPLPPSPSMPFVPLPATFSASVTRPSRYR
ncbi:hypothetical protein OPV22_002216 [Ensete ventricosum]|uniref:Uncharacterized protein n=1 Tax=Ensete ventricosum TaxID=4639 RepID=A0AAV8RXA8_ENSVE|nr:hypothetical protein OPV22_002216 [Ensete ventricosum]